MEPIKNSVCPVWLGYVFLIPLRKWKHDPDKILASHVKEGMNVLDYGCAMGYFSLPLAKMTGPKGNVYCVDLQEGMLKKLQKRADKAGVGSIIKTRQVGKTYNALELQNKIDFTLLFAVAHEVPDQAKLFHDLYTMTKPGGRVLFAEPRGHVPPDDFNRSLQLAISAKFIVSNEKPMPKGLSAFLLK